jgi:CrcB protein
VDNDDGPDGPADIPAHLPAHLPADQPVDPDVDTSERLLGRPSARAVLREAVRERGDLLAVIAVGGAIGAAARYGVSGIAPYRDGHFPWGTFVVNVSGCLAIGVLMVLVLDVWPHHRCLRPFAGVGVLGGYTTFSTYALESRDLMALGHAATAVAYLLGSVLAGVTATSIGILVTRAVVERPVPRGGGSQ